MSISISKPSPATKAETEGIEAPGVQKVKWDYLIRSEATALTHTSPSGFGSLVSRSDMPSNLIAFVEKNRSRSETVEDVLKYISTMYLKGMENTQLTTDVNNLRSAARTALKQLSSEAEKARKGSQPDMVTELRLNQPRGEIGRALTGETLKNIVLKPLTTPTPAAQEIARMADTRARTSLWDFDAAAEIAASNMRGVTVEAVQQELTSVKRMLGIKSKDDLTDAQKKSLVELALMSAQIGTGNMRKLLKAAQDNHYEFTKDGFVDLKKPVSMQDKDGSMLIREEQKPLDVLALLKEKPIAAATSGVKGLTTAQVGISAFRTFSTPPEARIDIPLVTTGEEIASSNATSSPPATQLPKRRPVAKRTPDLVIRQGEKAVTTSTGPQPAIISSGPAATISLNLQVKATIRNEVFGAVAGMINLASAPSKQVDAAIASIPNLDQAITQKILESFNANLKWAANKDELAQRVRIFANTVEEYNNAHTTA